MAAACVPTPGEPQDNGNSSTAATTANVHRSPSAYLASLQQPAGLPPPWVPTPGAKE